MVDRPPQPADDDNAKAQERRGLVRRLAVAGPLALGLLVALLLACVLWIPRSLYPPLTEVDLQGVSDAAKVQELKGARLKLQNDARTTLLQGFGALLLLTGAGIGAAVTLRQVRVSQDGLHATREQMQHTLETTREQLNLTEQGQVADRYTRAVEQLGHEKAPVRLGALYSLEHLAQDNPQYRQTVVDVVCAYLRMPYIPPARNDPDATHMEQAITPAEDGIRPAHPMPGQDPAQEELQVRKTGQRLLADHLRRPPQTSGQEAQLLPPSPQQAFWPSINLDLSGATLIDFNCARVSVIQVQCAGATFHGDAWFAGATFQGDAGFIEATFLGYARFGGETFLGYAGFVRAIFRGAAWFGAATFRGAAEFDAATFRGAAWFGEVTLQDPARFRAATFRGDARLRGATFRGDARFSGATFRGDARFSGAHVLLHFDNRDIRRVWPDGWIVRPDPTDPSRGTLVRAEDAKEPEPAAPPSDQSDHTDNR